MRRIAGEVAAGFVAAMFWLVTLPLWLPFAVYLRVTGKRIRFDH